MTEHSQFIMLGDVSVELVSDSVLIHACWKYQFGAVLKDNAVAAPKLRVIAYLVEQLPDVPSDRPYYVDSRLDSDGYEHCILRAFRARDDSILLDFVDGALAKLPAPTGESAETATVWLTRDVFPTGRFEDVTLVTLQPLLRRHGAYLVHAAGVAYDGEAVLFVGGSGSGKTTTCVNLVLHGWQLLANDVVIVRSEGDVIKAWPVPDTLTIRPKTTDLLPQLLDYMNDEQVIEGIRLPSDMLPAHRLVQGQWSSPVAVHAICFPNVAHKPITTIRPQMRAIALAILMQESIDRWDQSALAAHSDILSATCKQSACYAVELGSDLAQQENVLRQMLRAMVAEPL